MIQDQIIDENIICFLFRWKYTIQCLASISSFLFLHGDVSSELVRLYNNLKNLNSSFIALAAAGWCYQCDSRSARCQIDIDPTALIYDKVPCNGQCYIRVQGGRMLFRSSVWIILLFSISNVSWMFMGIWIYAKTIVVYTNFWARSHVAFLWYCIVSIYDNICIEIFYVFFL
jgi:hypothetical protein